MLFWYALGFVLFMVATCEYYAMKTGVPTVTSFPSSRKKMIELVVQESQRRSNPTPFRILDLGSGTGKLTLELGRALPNAEIIGLEISVFPFLLSHIRRFFWRVKNVHYRRVDFWDFDVSGYDAVTLYMTGKIRERMTRKLKAELSPGTYLVVNEIFLPDWEPEEAHRVGFFKFNVIAYRQA